MGYSSDRSVLYWYTLVSHSHSRVRSNVEEETGKERMLRKWKKV
jgi:hypothetical protein